MYKFTIYNASADNLIPASNPPGRTKLELSKPTFNGAWTDGLTWADEEAKGLPSGTYICIATKNGAFGPQGVWLFTVTEAHAVFVAVDFATAAVKAGA